MKTTSLSLPLWRLGKAYTDNDGQNDINEMLEYIRSTAHAAIQHTRISLGENRWNANTESLYPFDFDHDNSYVDTPHDGSEPGDGNDLDNGDSSQVARGRTRLIA